MKHVVIHPKDASTEFLNPIGAGVADATVLQGFATDKVEHTRESVAYLIANSDRTIMMGHGSPSGLFGMGFNSGFDKVKTYSPAAVPAVPAVRAVRAVPAAIYDLPIDSTIDAFGEPVVESVDDMIVEPVDDINYLNSVDSALDEEDGLIGTGYWPSEVIESAVAIDAKKDKKVSNFVSKYGGSTYDYGRAWGAPKYVYDPDAGFIIGSSTAKYLKEKENNIFIWCNADKYVLPNGLKGFFTGMFISEVSEAMYCGVKTATQDEVDESNNTFAEIMGQAISEELPTKQLHERVVAEYWKCAEHNQVARYNWERLYYR